LPITAQPPRFPATPTSPKVASGCPRDSASSWTTSCRCC